jgi:hypothetical protein
MAICGASSKLLMTLEIEINYLIALLIEGFLFVMLRALDLARSKVFEVWRALYL